MQPEVASSSSPPPSHIIVFEHRSERNAELVAEVLGGATASAASSGTHLEMHSFQPNRNTASVYQRLGAAATDLAAEQVDRIANTPGVAAVVPNELYSLPPYIAEPRPEGVFGASTADSPNIARTSQDWALELLRIPASYSRALAEA